MFSRSWSIGQVGDLERALDAVVVRDGDEVHALDLAPAVDIERLGEAFRRADTTQEPFGGAIGVFGVDVKVGFGLRHGLFVPEGVGGDRCIRVPAAIDLCVTIERPCQRAMRSG